MGRYTARTPNPLIIPHLSVLALLAQHPVLEGSRAPRFGVGRQPKAAYDWGLEDKPL